MVDAKKEKIGDAKAHQMAKSVNETKIRNGYKQPIDVNNIFETMRYIDMKNHPEHVIAILPAIKRIFPLAKGQHSNWIFVGARWGNIGLISVLGDSTGG